MAMGIPLVILILFGSYLTAHSADVDLLLEFKRSVVKADPQQVLSSWTPGAAQNYCNWQGITCLKDSSATWVDSIALADSQLQFTMWSGFSKFVRPRYLNFSSNAITGPIPQEIGNLKALVSLDFGENQLSGMLPSSLKGLTSLDTLILSDNRFVGAVPNGLCGGGKLRVFDMSFNKLTEISSDLRACQTLEVLSLERNNIQFDISNFPFAQLKKLRVLNLGYNVIKGGLNKDLAKSTALTTLQLHNNLISGRIPGALGLLTMLTVLDLSGNQLNDVIPETLGNLALLESVALARNRFSGMIPSSFGNMVGLTGRLDLSDNGFTGTVPLSLGNMKWIKLIDLSKNMLSGYLPESLGGCESLIFLSLSMNQLSGSIPAALFNMVSLSTLDLSSNNLSGEIPFELGQMVSLYTLDLSNNKLSGNIPTSLTNLQYLESLNLSSNSLSGEIPNSPLFRYLGKNSFLNNAGLCGDILNLSCGGEEQQQAQGGARFNFTALRNTIALVLELSGLLVLAGVMMFFILLLAFRLSHIEKYESVVDCFETHCSLIVACLYFLHLTKWHPRTTIKTLKCATENFNEANIVGNGSRATIYMGFFLESISWQGERIVAVKRLKGKPYELQRCLRECRVLAKVENQNVVKVLDWRLTAKELFVVLDLYVNSDLGTCLYNPTTAFSLEWVQRVQIACNVAQGLAYLHHVWWKDRIIHCNLHCSHILLDQNFEAHIIGLRYIRGHELENFCFEGIEDGFKAPECLSGATLSKEAEVYSYGIFLLELITRKSPVQSGLALDQNLQAWVTRRFPSKGVGIADPILLSTAPNSDSLLALIMLALSCTESSPEHRPPMSEVVAKLEKIKAGEIDCMINERMDENRQPLDKEQICVYDTLQSPYVFPYMYYGMQYPS